MAASTLSLLICLALVAPMSPAPGASTGQEAAPYPTRLETGEPVPSGFTLTSIDGETYSLEGDPDRPILLLFFRGTW